MLSLVGRRLQSCDAIILHLASLAGHILGAEAQIIILTEQRVCTPWKVEVHTFFFVLGHIQTELREWSFKYKRRLKSLLEGF
jgi:hypothetical protein